MVSRFLFLTVFTLALGPFAQAPLAATDPLLASLDSGAFAEPQRPARRTHTHESLLTELATVDRTIDDAEARIGELQVRITESSTALTALRQTIETRRDLSEAQQSTVRAQIQATWRLHRIQQQRAEQYRTPPRGWRRTQRYIAAVNDHLARQRGHARLALVDVMETVHQADAMQREISGDEQALRRERSNLKHLHASRQPVLLRLESAIEAAGDNLITLYAETDAVRQTLETADTALADHGLPWPLVGHVRTRFGETAPATKQASRGIQIDAVTGDTAHAVDAGVVVFADWMRGQGLLAVVDHGNGMMAVYGNNQRLMVSVGDRVASGDPIAVVGAEGSVDQARFYFELRLEGQAVDPLAWLTASPS
ncbi:MAG: peptidoglycan DD-metalloendopeptidase family protein [Pseudomonadota bacterium]